MPTDGPDWALGMSAQDVADFMAWYQADLLANAALGGGQQRPSDGDDMSVRAACVPATD